MSLRADGPTTVLYDGGCGLCVPTVAVLRRLDILRRVEFVDFTRNWSGLQQRFSGLDWDACARDMHAISPDGRVYAGFDAYRALAWKLPLLWVALPFVYLPPVAALGRRVYRRVADNRHGGTCTVNLDRASSPRASASRTATRQRDADQPLPL